MSALILALAPGSAPIETEPWTTPDLLSYARPEESVDLTSVCKVASHILYLLSGRRFGVRTETIRPFAGGSGFGWAQQYLPEHFALQNVAVPAGYGEQGPPYLVLNSPVQSISEIKIDGIVQSSDSYVIYDNRKLFRSNGACWPTAQRMDRGDDAVNTCAITYQWGTPVPEGGKLAAQVFATELAKYVNKESCALPDRTLSVTRQGVSQTVLDASQFIKQARTGLYLTDLWLGSVNPGGNRRRPTITSPETVINARLTS